MSFFNVFILAAGLGERLRPITDCIPKPLLPITGKPALQFVLEKVSGLTKNKIGINLHHKKNFMEKWIHQSPFSNKVTLFPEDPILGTGGALKNAESFLKDSPFLVHNSDIISDIDIEKLIEFHTQSRNLATLTVHDYPDFNSLLIDDKDLLRGLIHSQPSSEEGALDNWDKILAFTGIAVYNPEFLRFLPEGNSSVVNAWMKATHEGYKIGTYNVSGCHWSDIGTPVSYARAVINHLRQNGEMVFFHPDFERCSSIDIDGYVVIEQGNAFNKKIALRNCMVLPESSSYITTSSNENFFENCIIGPDFRITLNESYILSTSEKADALLIGIGGSDRKYYRIKETNKSIVMMESPKDDPDFHRHLEYTKFFKKYSIPVPELIDFEKDTMQAFFEDVGDISLYSWLQCPRNNGQIDFVFKQVLDVLVILHTIATHHVTECPLLQNRIFNYEHLRWETTYFLDSFVKGAMNLNIQNAAGLGEEFHRLALKVDSFQKTLIHRDFQSQNIMVKKGVIPKILDYQGARMGPPAYDVVSILWDPYYRLEDEMRTKLLDYYIHKVTSPDHSFNKKRQEVILKEFMDSLLPCRLQRHMQALGAYGFLSTVKGKKYFTKHIPEGLRLIREDATLAKEAYPKLYNLATTIS